MKTDDMAQWMLEEHVKVDQLARLLREKVAGVPSYNLEHWIPEIRQQFEKFRAHMMRHVALEEQDGYLAPVVERRPGLAVEVERLQHEHADMAYIMDDIWNTLKRVEPDNLLLVRDICNRINDLLSYIAHHDKDENLLVMFTITQDIGTKD